MTNSAEWICYSFFLASCFTIFSSFFSYFQGKPLGAASTFTTRNYSRQPAVVYLFIKSVNLPFMLQLKSNFIKDVSSSNASHSFAAVQVLMKRTFFAFAFISFLFLLMGSQGCSMFLLDNNIYYYIYTYIINICFFRM